MGVTVIQKVGVQLF